MADSGNDETANIVFSMLVTVGEHRLVIPRAVISEVRAWQSPKPVLQLREGQEQPSWLLGEYSSPEGKIPLLSLQAMLDPESADDANSSRVVILNSLTKGLSVNCQRPRYAIVCQGFPTLIEVREPDSARAASQQVSQCLQQPNLIASQFEIGVLSLTVPNLPAIEARIAKVIKA